MKHNRIKALIAEVRDEMHRRHPRYDSLAISLGPPQSDHQLSMHVRDDDMRQGSDEALNLLLASIESEIFHA